MGPGAVFVVAFAVVPMGPESLVIVSAAGASGVATNTVGAALAASAFLASVGYVLVGGERARSQLDIVRQGLMPNIRTIAAIDPPRRWARSGRRSAADHVRDRDPARGERLPLLDR